MKTSKKNQIGCGLGAKFGPNYVQCCEKSKETGNTIGFFSYFTWDYLLKQESLVVKPPEWKFIAIIARNTKILRMLGPIFCPIWVKNGKKNLIIFNNFTLVSQS